jgi:hypothetical protein
MGYPHIGWHIFRHAFRAWLGDGDATLSQMTDLMRHSAIATWWAVLHQLV